MASVATFQFSGGMGRDERIGFYTVKMETAGYGPDTIVAIATPPGRGGIGIVRLSGLLSREIAERVIRTGQPLEHARARFADIVEVEGDAARKLDEALVTWFAGPASYTGEDVVEIAAHGSPVVLDFLVRHALRHGARLAHAGEFTERAFLSGRIDLTQAEAVRDLIEAQTLMQARTAAGQLGGALSRRVAPFKEQLLLLITTLEAGVDFAEDDVDVMPAVEIAERLRVIADGLAPIAASYQQGRLVRDGLKLALVGRPNAGKSSLFNRLVERDRAIVTAMPGTTRDPVTEVVAMGGIPVELVDTAGLRVSADEAEAIGIEKTNEAIAEADLVLLVLDAAVCGRDVRLEVEERALLQRLEGRKTLVVVNKMDLLAGDFSGPEVDAAFVSALRGTGILELRERILRMMMESNPEEQTGVLTSLRHYDAVSVTYKAVAAAEGAVRDGIPHEMVLLDLYGALEGMDRLTGVTAGDEVLNRIFSTFCIGK